MKKIIKTFILGTAIFGGISLSEVMAMNEPKMIELKTPGEQQVEVQDIKAELLNAVYNKDVEKLKSLINLNFG